MLELAPTQLRVLIAALDLLNSEKRVGVVPVQYERRASRKEYELHSPSDGPSRNLQKLYIRIRILLS